jgi:hypothetical protein
MQALVLKIAKWTVRSSTRIQEVSDWALWRNRQPLKCNEAVDDIRAGDVGARAMHRSFSQERKSKMYAWTTCTLSGTCSGWAPWRKEHWEQLRRNRSENWAMGKQARHHKHSPWEKEKWWCDSKEQCFLCFQCWALISKSQQQSRVGGWQLKQGVQALSTMELVWWR